MSKGMYPSLSKEFMMVLRSQNSISPISKSIASQKEEWKRKQLEKRHQGSELKHF
jgi:hypothetical protein